MRCRLLHCSEGQGVVESLRCGRNERTAFDPRSETWHQPGQVRAALLFVNLRPLMVETPLGLVLSAGVSSNRPASGRICFEAIGDFVNITYSLHC